MTLKSLTAAAGLAVAFWFGAGAAQAQDSAFFGEMAKRLGPSTPATAGAAATVSSVDLKNPAAPISAGFHYGHTAFCGYFLDSSNNQWFFAFLTDVDGSASYPNSNGFIAGINNLYIGQGMTPPCAMGHWMAWFVTNTSSGAFNETYSYPYYDPAYGNF